MTISEALQSLRIREMRAGRSGTAALILNCENRTTLIVDAGVEVPNSSPKTDDGPWTMFAVTWWGGPSPGASLEPRGDASSMLAGDLVRLLERLGWPEAQLGKRWKKRGVAARK